MTLVLSWWSQEPGDSRVISVRPQEGFLPSHCGVPAHSIHRRKIRMLEGELLFRAVASSCFGICPDRFCCLLTHTWWAPVTPLGASLSEAAGSRASRAVWALSHWEFCHLNSSACFGVGKMGILDRRPALYQFALLPPLQSWKTASNFVFLQIHLQEESMAATWLWLMDGFDVVMNKTLKVKLSSDWIFSFNTPFVLLWLVKHKCRLRKFSWQKDFQFWWSPWSCVGFELFFLQVFVVLNSI